MRKFIEKIKAFFDKLKQKFSSKSVRTSAGSGGLGVQGDVGSSIVLGDQPDDTAVQGDVGSSIVLDRK